MYVGHFGQLSEMFSSLRTGESLKVKVYEKSLIFIVYVWAEGQNPRTKIR